MRGLAAALAVTAVGGAAVAGCGPNTPVTQSSSLDSTGWVWGSEPDLPGSNDNGSSVGSPSIATGGSGYERSAEVLNSLPVKGRAPKTGYSRDEFGQAWSDDVTVSGGHNGCDTRIICTQF